MRIMDRIRVMMLPKELREPAKTLLRIRDNALRYEDMTTKQRHEAIKATQKIRDAVNRSPHNRGATPPQGDE